MQLLPLAEDKCLNVYSHECLFSFFFLLIAVPLRRGPVLFIKKMLLTKLSARPLLNRFRVSRPPDQTVCPPSPQPCLPYALQNLPNGTVDVGFLHVS